VSKSHSPDNLLALIDDCIAGSESAWRMLFEAVSPLLYKMLRGGGAPDHLSEDIVGDLFVKLMENKAQCLRRASFNSEAKFRKWLISIARNLLVSHSRHQTHVQNLPKAANRPTNPGGSHYSHTNASDSLIADLCNRDQLEKALSCLSIAEQWVVTLAYFDDLKLREIADVTGKPVGTVTAILSRAREKMRRRLHLRRSSIGPVHIADGGA